MGRWGPGVNFTAVGKPAPPIPAMPALRTCSASAAGSQSRQWGIPSSATH